MVQVLISTGPEAHHLFEPCGSDAKSALGLKDDLVGASRRRRRGHLRADGNLTVRSIRRDLKDGGRAGRLRRGQTEAEQVQKGQLVLLRTLVQKLNDRRQ